MPEIGNTSGCGALRPAALTPIIGLLGSRRPPAISRLVVARIVNPVKGRAGRARPHIGQKILELLPPVAKGNPAPSIVRINAAVGIAATDAHR